MLRKKHILVVDDDNSVRKELVKTLREEGFNAHGAVSGETALNLIGGARFDVVLLDIWMPEMDGIETLKRIKEYYPELAVVMISGHGTIENAVTALKFGAYDYLEKPVYIDKMVVTIRRAIEESALRNKVKSLESRIPRHDLIGSGEAMRRLKQEIELAAPTMGRVLIYGENGSGKELVARMIHARSDRSDGPFVDVNCAAIPEELIESELFGHEKGAFTGAATRRRGKFEEADGGAIFLDEIGDMSLKVQAKVLRVLEENSIQTVGGDRQISTDVRVIAASNKDLNVEMKAGRFREDLFFRLNVIPIKVPPLRERIDDLPDLIEYYMTFFCKAYGKMCKKIAEDAMDALERYNWPGNVRELRNLIERLVIMTPGEKIERRELPMPIAPGVSDVSVLESFFEIPFKEARDQFEREYIERTLIREKGNISKSANELGITRNNLHLKIKSLGIDVERIKIA